MVDENDLLAMELTKSNIDEAKSTRGAVPWQMGEESQSPPIGIDFQQWVVGPNDTYRPTGRTVASVPPGVYRFMYDNAGVYLERVNVVTDKLVVLPDSSNERVLRGMEKFWNSKDRYLAHGLLYKRGVILWGPPGSGKSASLQLLMGQLVAAGGIVIISVVPGLTVTGLKAVRRIEPHRNIITVFEDVDEQIQQHGEHELLALLDGESQISNVVNVATTNYPDKLGARIMNRPSRFDERIYVGMPSAEAREVYLRNVAKGLAESQLHKWVKDTENLSVAHLRELAAAVLCLDQDYDDVIKRLKSMKSKPKEVDGFGNETAGVGFQLQASSQAAANSPTVPYR